MAGDKLPSCRLAEDRGQEGIMLLEFFAEPSFGMSLGKFIKDTICLVGSNEN